MQAVQERVMTFDRPDITSLVREHYEFVFHFCARRIGVEWAADVAQETFVTAQKALPRYSGRSAVSTWLLGIAHNECRRHSRFRRNYVPTVELSEEAGAWVGEEDAMLNRQALQQALDQLSLDHREVVLLHEIEGLRYEEIAEVLRIPLGTVKSRLHHAHQNLRLALEAGEGVSL